MKIVVLRSVVMSIKKAIIWDTVFKEIPEMPG